MAKLIVVRYVCDRCSEEFDSELFRYEMSVPSTPSGKPARTEADLCDGCAVMLDEYVEGFGFRPIPKEPKKAAQSEKGLSCRFPGCTFVGSNQMSISAHRNRKKHHA
jgi:hypothetical protein